MYKCVVAVYHKMTIFKQLCRTYDYIGNKYYGILIYADDIFLLSPSAYGLQIMLTMCSSFANQNGLYFNVKKTQCIMFHHKQCVDTRDETI